MNARSEPLLWLQLLALGAFPLEALLLLLLLAGDDPGPFPGLERVLCWSLGALAPGILLWRQPADVWSLLVIQTPARGRRDLQRRLSSLQEALLPRLGLLLGVVLALPLLWWLDGTAAFASAFSPVADSPRLFGLLLAALVLAVMLWQWQQLLQALWLLSRNPAVIAAAAPMASVELEERRLCLGLPLLLPDPLKQRTRPQPATAAPPTVSARTSAADASQTDAATRIESESAGIAASTPEEQASTQEDDGARPAVGSPGSEAVASGGDVPVPIEPEQGAEQNQGSALDEQIP